MQVGQHTLIATLENGAGERVGPAAQAAFTVNATFTPISRLRYELAGADETTDTAAAEHIEKLEAQVVPSAAFVSKLVQLARGLDNSTIVVNNVA